MQRKKKDLSFCLNLSICAHFNWQKGCQVLTSLKTENHLVSEYDMKKQGHWGGFRPCEQQAQARVVRVLQVAS